MLSLAQSLGRSSLMHPPTLSPKGRRCVKNMDSGANLPNLECRLYLLLIIELGQVTLPLCASVSSPIKWVFSSTYLVEFL